MKTRLGHQTRLGNQANVQHRNQIRVRILLRLRNKMANKSCDEKRLRNQHVQQMVAEQGDGFKLGAGQTTVVDPRKIAEQKDDCWGYMLVMGW